MSLLNKPTILGKVKVK